MGSAEQRAERNTGSARDPEKGPAATKPFVSVIVACYNEEEILLESCRELTSTLESFAAPFEIIFVDDASRDRTRELIDAVIASYPQHDLRVIRHAENRGRGATVSEGFRAAKGEIVGYLDIDLEVHSRYIPSLVGAIQAGADIATVRRIYAFQLRSLDRYLMSRGYTWLVRRLLDVELWDTETGYKFFRRASVLPLLDDIEDEGWFWDTEFMVRAVRRGFRIEEIPGAYIRRFDKTSTVSGLRDSAEYFARLLAFRRKLPVRPE